ncbi:tetratricopeptide repeat protein [Flavobacterium sp. WC2509]|uniref:tetratricopeptide repeat protein n=1 Tax=Flavobacterium sp. WC2509 TaxID=3461406 RepID=UPI004043E618
MKNRYVIIASALFLSVAGFAQKKELTAAEKALKEGKSNEAITILTGAESLIANDADKAQFLFLKGNAYFDLIKKNVDTEKNLQIAAKTYQDLIEVEKASGKIKYSTQAANSIFGVKGRLINSAIEDTKVNKNAEGAQKLYEAYLLEKKDTINLYYAASTYVGAKEYDKALKLYEELKKLNFSGKATYYYAVSKVNGKEDVYNTAAERDKMIKLGTHEKPRSESVPSKRGEIYKNITLIYVSKGQIDEAKKAVSEARIANPDDASLILTEANLYLETKDMVTYQKLITQVLEKNPNDVSLVFNLGVINANAKNYVDAEKYYKRAIEIDPKYVNAYINLAAMKLEDEKAIIDKMNKLGTSAEDTKKYNALKKKREDLFKSTIPYLEKAVELDPANKDVSKTLLNVYSALEMMPQYKALKAKMK